MQKAFFSKWDTIKDQKSDIRMVSKIPYFQSCQKAAGITGHTVTIVAEAGHLYKLDDGSLATVSEGNVYFKITGDRQKISQFWEEVGKLESK